MLIRRDVKVLHGSWCYVVATELTDGRKCAVSMEVHIMARRVISTTLVDVVVHTQVRRDEPGSDCDLVGRCSFDVSSLLGMKIYEEAGGITDPDGDPNAQPEALWQRLEQVLKEHVEELTR